MSLKKKHSPIEGQTIEVTPDHGKVLSKVTIPAAAISKVQWETVDQNGYYEYRKPSNDYYGMAGINLTVNVKPPLQAKTVDSSTASQTIVKDSKDYYGLSSVTINPYVLDSKTVDPSTNSQTITSDVDGLSSVIVNAVTSDIDSNISAGNIKNGVTILGVQGTYEGQIINNQNKSVDSSTNSQSITYDSGYTGLGTVTVNPYTLQNKLAGNPVAYVNSDVNAGEMTITPSSGYDGMSSATVNKIAILQSVTINPSASGAQGWASSDYEYVYGVAHVTVPQVTSSIDVNITAGNIKNGVTILGVQGNYSGTTINNQNKTVDSSTNSQSVTYDSGYTGLGTVTIPGLDLDSCYNLAASI